MQVTLEQVRFSFSTRYEVAIGADRWVVRFQWSWFLKRFVLLDGGARVIATVRQRWAWFRPNFEFSLRDGAIYRLTAEKLFRGVCHCQGNGESYAISRQNGRRYSVSRGDSQVAAFSLSGERYQLQMADDVNAPLMVCLAIMLDATGNAGSDL